VGTAILEPPLIPRGDPLSVRLEQNEIGGEIEEPFVDLKNKPESLLQKRYYPALILPHEHRDKISDLEWK
jgi:hypothetical protein